MVHVHGDLDVVAPCIALGDGLRKEFDVVQGLVHIAHDVGEQPHTPGLEEGGVGLAVLEGEHHVLHDGDRVVDVGVDRDRDVVEGGLH